MTCKRLLKPSKHRSPVGLPAMLLAASLAPVEAVQAKARPAPTFLASFSEGSARILIQVRATQPAGGLLWIDDVTLAGP